MSISPERSTREQHVPKLKKLSEYIKDRAIAHLGHSIRADDTDPIRQVVWGSKSENNTTNNRDDARLNAPNKFR
eukprot:10986164-Karenia_brevis.AAC.1